MDIDGPTASFNPELSKGQLAKFKSLQKNLVIYNNVAYIPMDQLHGPLLTSKRETAKTLVNNYINKFGLSEHLRAILIKKNRIENSVDVITSIGLQLLLNGLAGDKKCKKSVEYRSASALVAMITADHPQLKVDGFRQTKSAEEARQKAMSQKKKEAKVCALTGKKFVKGMDKVVHHIEGESERPDLAANSLNLIVICEDVHDAYHKWQSENNKEITKVSLKQFAKLHGHDTNFRGFQGK